MCFPALRKFLILSRCREIQTFRPSSKLLALLALRSIVSTFCVALCLIWSAFPATAQGDHTRAQEEVTKEGKHDISPPLREIEPPLIQPGPAREKPLRPWRASRQSGAPRQVDPILQRSPSSSIATTLGNNFDGLGHGFVGPQGSFTVNFVPPDPNGAVGATQFVEWVNTSLAVFDKTTGNVLYGPAAGSTLWTGFGAPCATTDDGDGIVQYDKAADRWVIMQPIFESPYMICVAVSTTSDATGTYNRYAFPMPNFPDYPKLGVWPDGYYMSFNMFNGSSGPFLGGRMCALDRGAMLNGAAATQQCFQLSSSFGGLLPSDLDGATPPPAGSPNYFVSFDLNSLDLWKSHVDFQTPSNSTLTGPTNIPVAAFSEACGGGTCIPQSGTTQLLDSLADRLMYRLAYRNFPLASPPHESLVVAHSVDPGSGNSGIRWYELRNPGGTPTVYQQGTFAPDSDSRWMGSIAMDKVGNMLVGYSDSSGSIHPGIRYTGRIVTDPLSTMQGESIILNGGGSQTSNVSRWGDYSSMAVDPVNDCTFWYTQEYLKSDGTFNWSTRIASASFPNCNTRVTTLGDLNGDGEADIVWRNFSTGEDFLWLMNGASLAGTSQLPQIADTNWQIVGIGDFNGDGKADILWHNLVTGDNYLWLMKGSQITASGFLPNVGNLNWQVQGVGDFNGDGKADILWRNLSTGENYLWLMNGISLLNNGPLPTTADQHWQIAGVADFNNDGKADILWRNVSTGENFMWLMNGLSIASSGPLPQIADLNWQVGGVGKFNGANNGAGIVWRRSGTGENYMWLMNGTSIASSGPLPNIADLSWNIVGVGDFDGDGTADILWRNGSTGDTYIWLMNGLTLSSASSLPTVNLSWQLR